MSIILATALGLSLFIPWYYPDRLLAGYFLLLALALLIYSRATSKQPLITMEFLKQPVLWFSLAYFGLGLFSWTYVSQENQLEVSVLRRLAAGYFLYNLLPIYIFTFGPTNLKDARTILLGLLPIGALNAILYLIAVFCEGGIHWSAVSFQGFSKNVTGDINAITAIASFALIPMFSEKRIRYALLSVTVLCTMACLFAFSKAAAAGICVSVLLICYFGAKPGRQRTHAMLIAALVFATSALALWTLIPNRLHTIIQKESFLADGSLSIRGREIAAAQQALRFERNPTGWRISPKNISGNKIFNPCNLFLQSVVELGYFGALLLLGFYLSAFGLFIHNLIDLRNGPHTAKFLNLAAFCIFLERFIRDMVDYHELTIALTLAPYACVGLAVFIRSGLDRRKNAPGNTLNN